MALEVFEREVEEIRILDLMGRLTIKPEFDRVKEILLSLSETDKSKLLLNLRDVAFLNKEGVNFLLSLHPDAGESDRYVKLFSVSKSHIDESTWKELAETFSVYDSEDAAINSFFPDREVRHFDILEFVKSEKEERESGGGDPVIHSESKPQADSSEG